MYGTFEQSSVLCDENPLDQLSSQALQSPVRNGCDFGIQSSQDNSESSPNLSNTTAIQSSSFTIFEFVNLSPQSSPRLHSTVPAKLRTGLPLEKSAQPSSPTTSSSASLSPSIEPHFVHCVQCQIKFNNVKSTLEHVAAKHFDTRWPCVASSCEKHFKNGKDLRRHLDDQHFDIKYTCSCGRRSRRDKHKDHIKHCQHTGDGFYTCQCGNRTEGHTLHDLEEHQHHIDKKCPTWQPRKKGRRPKTK